jgi:hypothetical protein
MIVDVVIPEVDVVIPEFDDTNFGRVIHIFLFIFAMINIKNIYELHTSPVTGILEGHSDSEHYQSLRRATFNPASSFYTAS